MFSFFKKPALGDKAPDKHPFYGAYLRMGRYEIQLFHNNQDAQAIDIEQVSYITIYSFDDFEAHQRCWIHLKPFSGAALSITTLAGGYQELENWLLALPDFNTEAYLRIKGAHADSKEQLLWEKKTKPNFRITDTGQNHQDTLEAGIYLESREVLLPWGTYEELATQNFVITKKKKMPNPAFREYHYTIPTPTLFNGLQLAALTTTSDGYEEHPKLYLPVLHYTAEIQLGSQRREQFSRLTAHLEAYFLQPASGKHDLRATLPEPARKSWECRWQSGKVTVTLYCPYREEAGNWDTTCYLTIAHVPDSSSFYESIYGQQLELGGQVIHRVFDLSIQLNDNYREHDNVIYTPQCFRHQFEDHRQFVVWNDTREGIIGIGNPQFSLLYPSDEVTALTLAIQNFRGTEGGNRLEIIGIKGTRYAGSVSSVIRFKNYSNDLSILLGKPVSNYVYDDHY